MNIVICTIAKLENQYIYFWARYHLSLGFKHIYIFDNNDIDGERIEDVFINTPITDYVTIIDVRGQRKIQLSVYNDFYKSYSFDWCAFIDIDEYITFRLGSGVSQIEQFVSRFPYNNAIVLNWLCFGDSGHIEYSDLPVTERFTIPIMPLDFVATQYNGIPENYHVKSIVKKDLDIDWEEDRYPSPNPHTPARLTNICNASGIIVNNSPWHESDYRIAYIRHYITMSLEEYTRKINRGSVVSGASQKYSFPRYFRYNRITLRKLCFVYKHSRLLVLYRVLLEKYKWKLIYRKSPFVYFFKSYRNHI